MTLSKFEGFVQENAWSNPNSLNYEILGIAGETGELVELYKKSLRPDAKPLDTEEAALELGDILHYCARAAHTLGYSMEEIMEMNMAKIIGRRERATGVNDAVVPNMPTSG